VKQNGARPRRYRSVVGLVQVTNKHCRHHRQRRGRHCARQIDSCNNRHPFSQTARRQTIPERTNPQIHNDQGTSSRARLFQECGMGRYSHERIALTDISFFSSKGFGQKRFFVVYLFAFVFFAICCVCFSFRFFFVCFHCLSTTLWRIKTKMKMKIRFYRMLLRNISAKLSRIWTTCIWKSDFWKSWETTVPHCPSGLYSSHFKGASMSEASQSPMKSKLLQPHWRIQTLQLGEATLYALLLPFPSPPLPFPFFPSSLLPPSP